MIVISNFFVTSETVTVNTVRRRLRHFPALPETPLSPAVDDYSI